MLLYAILPLAKVARSALSPADSRSFWIANALADRGHVSRPHEAVTVHYRAV